MIVTLLTVLGVATARRRLSARPSGGGPATGCAASTLGGARRRPGRRLRGDRPRWLFIWLLAGMLASAPIGDLGAVHPRVHGHPGHRRPAAAEPAAHRPHRAVPRPARASPASSPASSPIPGPRSSCPATDAARSRRSGRRVAVDPAGRGDGCGGLLTGSGFVAAPELRRHQRPRRRGHRRHRRRSTGARAPADAGHLRPETDVAVLRVDGSTRRRSRWPPTASRRGTGGAILGYPGGGSLTHRAGRRAAVRPRHVGATSTTTTSPRRVDLRAPGRACGPGNSGGPFVLPDGRVAGVVFARSVSEDDVAYALTRRRAGRRPGQAQPARPRPVSTGRVRGGLSGASTATCREGPSAPAWPSGCSSRTTRLAPASRSSLDHAVAGDLGQAVEAVDAGLRRWRR